MPAVNLKAERLNRGLTVKAAAAEMEIEARTLVNAENGSFTPRPENAKKIADVYGYQVTDIWPVDDPRLEPSEATS